MVITRLLTPTIALQFFLILSSCFMANVAQAQLSEAVTSTPFAVAGDNTSPAQSSDQFSPERLQEYERQLNAVLKTRKDEERQFIGLLVGQIGAGAVSPQLVQTSFKWVRKKRPGTTFPFLYFERVLRIMATQQGVGDAIPPFDMSIIGQPNPSNQDTDGTETNQEAGILIR